MQMRMSEPRLTLSFADLYVSHNYRPSNYTEQDYLAEYRTILDAVTADSLIQVKNNFGGPGVCCIWQLGDLIDNQNYLGLCASHSLMPLARV